MPRVAAALLLLAACHRADDVLAPPDGLDWVACDDGFLCATFPHDGADLSVALHTGTGEDPTLAFLGAGGPGGSSVSLARALVTAYADADPDLWAARSWIGMDDRGTGDSDPITCVDGAWFDDLRARDPLPADDAAAAGLAASRDAFQDGCLADRDPEELAKLSTVQHVADLDALADALGQETVDFMGFSYGTRLGGSWAATAPDRVRRFVLDGVVAPDLTREAFLADQAAGFELALERFFDRCAADPACPLHEDPAGTFDRVLAAATAAPIPALGSRALTRNDLRWGITSLLYSPDDETIAAGLSAADAGDGEILLEAADAGWGRDPVSGEYDPILQRYWAIGCLDTPWPAGWSDDDVFAFTADLDAEFPRLGATLATGELTCIGWPAVAEPPPVSAPSAPPLLLVNGLYDPATPYEGAERAQEALGNGSALVPFDGDGHVALFSDASGCSYAEERAFVLEGTLDAGAACP